MKLFLDENVAKSIYEKLVNEGFDVKSVSELKLIGSKDIELLRLASEEKRIFVTHDKDFINIAYIKNLKHSGIIILKFKLQISNEIFSSLLWLLKSDIKLKLENNLAILSETEVKIYNVSSLD